MSGQKTTGIRVFACEGQIMDLKCTVGYRIRIVTAFYGRHTGSERCGPTNHPSCDSNAANNATGQVDSHCNGFSACVVQVCQASLGVDLKSTCTGEFYFIFLGFERLLYPRIWHPVSVFAS